MLLATILLSKIVLTLCALPKYHQNNYAVIATKTEIEFLDENYITDLKIDIFWTNKTMQAVNVTGNLVAEVGTAWEGSLQLYREDNNEYKEYPLTIRVNLCDEYIANSLNIRSIIKDVTNVSDCPLKKGSYYCHNALLDYTGLPPFIPIGNYKASGKLFYDNKLVASGQGYGSIVPLPST